MPHHFDPRRIGLAASPPTGPELVTTALEAEAGRPSHCAAHRARIAAKLEEWLSAQRIYQDLVGEVGFSGSYQSVKRYVRQLRDQQARPGMLYLQSTGALGAQVALLQSPIPPTAPTGKHEIEELSGTMLLAY